VTVPGQVGCAHCAAQRVRAAAADAELTAATSPEDGALEFVRHTVREQLAAIQASPPNTGPLTRAVLRVAPTGITRHVFVPLADCPVCGGARRLARRDGHDTADRDTWAASAEPLAGWVDPVSGVIPELIVDPAPEVRNQLPIVVSAAPPHVVDVDGSLRRMPVGWGKGLTAVEAVRGAVSEAIERYAASLPDPRRVVWRRICDLDGDVLDPREVTLYTDQQYEQDRFPYARFDPDQLHPWIRGTWLGRDRSVWVPAVFVFLRMTLGPENLICQGTSNGLAASNSFTDAALRATLELVERDAFMVAWQTATPCPQIKLDHSLAPALREAIDAIEELGAAVELRLLPTSVCGTTVIALAFGDGKTWPGVTLGLAADFDPQRAVRGAILELCQTSLYLRRLLLSDGFVPPAAPEAVHDMLDHATFYFDPTRAKEFERIRLISNSVPLAELSSEDAERTLDVCATTLTEASVRVALIDTTPADVAAGGFRVVRAVSPDLEPISYGHGLARTPTPRTQSQTPPAKPPPLHPLW
jgi:ribosomal protein S12 methylthiotransferase accessory factor